MVSLNCFRLCMNTFLSVPRRCFFSPQVTTTLNSTVYVGRFEEDSVVSVALFFTSCFVSAVALSIPVGTTCMACRPKKRSASFAKVILVLPIAVTGAVLIVQNSLALAFSLAGIVAGAGIRFRTNMRDISDSLFFSYTMLIVEAIDYGSKPSAPKGVDSE